LAATLKDLTAACGGIRAAAVCRELTKLHEQIVRGSLAELSAAAMSDSDGGSPAIPARGEFVIVVGFAPLGSAADVAARMDDDVEAARSEVERLIGSGVARGEAARRVAAATGLSRRRLYGAEPGR